MKKTLLLISFILLVASSSSYAAKLVEIKVLDKDIIVLHFADGEAQFRDDATGKLAYWGHDWEDGYDSLVVFGNKLDLEKSGLTASWVIVSSDDKNYGKKGKAPEAVYRKSKVLNTTHSWEYALDHWIYLKLPESLQKGKKYTVNIDSSTESDKESIAITFDPTKNISEAIHVNMIGYAPGSPVKSADLYLWMGDGGPRDYSSFEGNKVSVINTETGELTEVGEVSFWKKVTDTEAEKRNMTGSPVWNADFSKFSKAGSYRLVIEDVGCSREFEITEDAFFEPYKYSVRGYYYMRIGEDRLDMVPVPRRPLFIPGKDPEGFTVYMTDLDPFDPEWREHRGDTWDEPHFKPAKESMFWKRRLQGNPTNPNAIGGHSDAADWDRHLAHVSNIYDLLLPYLLSSGELNHDNLNIGESGNGMPDLIDEAKNEVDLFLSLRVGDAYAQGLTNPSGERNVMFQAGTTTMAAWANAANCAMIAECYRIAGNSKLEKYYTKEAIKAFNFASDEEDKMLDQRQDVGDGVMRGRDFMMMAAAFLYNVTGDTKWEDIMAEESMATSTTSNLEDRKQGIQIWATAAYLFSPQERHYAELYDNMKASVKNRAMEHNVKHMDLRPSRRSSNDNYWQTPHNLHNVVVAHAISNDAKDKELFEKSMVLEADWGLGRNPANTVEMTGLGEQHIENCYTTGRNDGTPGVHPGQTPYNNLDPWGSGPNLHNGSNPRWFTEKCYPAWEEGWPHQEGFFQSRYCWANGEFTPRQTMRGKMLLLGYLQYIYGE